MKIMQISPYINYQRTCVSKQIENTNFCEKTQVRTNSNLIELSQSFTGPLLPDVLNIKKKAQEKLEEKNFVRFLQKDGKVSVREYNYIKNKHPYIFDKAMDMVIEDSFAYTMPMDMAKFAINAKNYFDNCDRLKNKKYCILSIGTSPAPLTEALKNLGCDVIFMPISGVRFCNEEADISKNENLNLSLDYVKEKSNELKLDKDTQYVVLDYAFSRRTLNTVSTLISKDNFLTKEENVWSISLAELLKSIYENNDVPLKVSMTEEETNQFLRDYDDDLYCSDFTPICNVPHFYLEDGKNDAKFGSVSSNGKSREELFLAFDKYSKPLARAYSLCTLGIIEDLGGKLCK